MQMEKPVTTSALTTGTWFKEVISVLALFPE